MLATVFWLHQMSNCEKAIVKTVRWYLTHCHTFLPEKVLVFFCVFKAAQAVKYIKNIHAEVGADVVTLLRPTKKIEH